MPSLRRARRTGPPLLATTIAGAAVALLPAVAGAVGAPQQREGRATFDARSGVQSAAPGQAGAAARALKRRLGEQGVVAVDPVTGTPRQVLRTDGTLTGPSGAPAAQIALDYVRAHRDVFRLTDADLAALGEPEVVVSGGTRYLRWTQRHAGIPVTGAGLRAQVSSDGRLIAIQGAPLTDTAPAGAAAPRIGAATALQRARRDAGAAGATPSVRRTAPGARRTTTFADDSRARLAIFPTPDGNRLVWSLLADVGPQEQFAYLVDATDGTVLKRTNLVRHLSGHGTAWSYAPSDGPNERMLDGYTQELKPFEDDWILGGGTRLAGRYAHAYSDVDDNDRPGLAEEVPSNETTPPDPEDPEAPVLPVWNYPFTPVTTGFQCPTPAYPCSWESLAPGTWETNREQNAVQSFWFVNRFHDHLRDAPGIGFDDVSGNFELSADGLSGDPVIVNTSDGADLTFLNGDDEIAHHPDDAHLSNANMFTPPDGLSPRMQMYLFMAFAGDANTLDGNGGDDASVVYHEYGHGLSSRLVVDEDGVAALNAPQSGAMGEAWSDWYALDLLVAEGDQADTPAPGEVMLGGYLGGGVNTFRYGSLDCPVGISATNCPAGGGYTFGDFGRVWAGTETVYGPQVHADGEIWGQTLWDLRTAVIAAREEAGGTYEEGLRDVRALVTGGMRGSVANPSFLEMRDQILAADQNPDVTNGVYHDVIWEVFAARGMGVYADSYTGFDPAPQESFDLPPAPEDGTAPLSGVVTDAATGTPIQGATVWLPGMTTGIATNAQGRYTLAAANVDAYPRLNVFAPGYDEAPVGAVTVAPGGSARDVALRRNWALSSGGTEIADFTAPDLTGYGCGPQDAIDGSKAFGWGSFQPAYDGALGDPPGPRSPRALTLRLPQAVDVSGFAIDPGAICGDDDSASLGEFTLETSVDGTTWRTTAASTFTRNDNHRLNAFAPAAGTGAAVRFVRVTMLRPQGGPGRSGTHYMDLAELAIHGTATPDPPREEPREQPREQPREEPRQPEPRTPEPRRPVADTRAPHAVGKPALPKRRTLTALRSRAGLALRVRFDETASVVAEVTLPAATARRLGLTRARRGTYRLSRATLRSLGARKTGTLRLKLGTAASRRLSRTRSLRATITITATDASGNRARVVVKPLLKR